MKKSELIARLQEIPGDPLIVKKIPGPFDSYLNVKEPTFNPYLVQNRLPGLVYYVDATVGKTYSEGETIEAIIL